MKLLLLLVLILLPPLAASAQVPASAPAQAAAPSQEDVDKLVKQLNDPAARARLITQLQALDKAEAAAKPDTPAPLEAAGSHVLAFLRNHVASLDDEMAQLTQAFSDFPRLARIIEHRWQNPDTALQWKRIGASLLLVLSSGLLAYQLALIALRRLRRRIEAVAPVTYFHRLGYATLRLLLAALPIAAFIGAAVAIISYSHEAVVVGLTSLQIVYATGLLLVVLAVARFILAPDVPNLRLVPSIGDKGSRYLYRWTRRLAGIGIYTYFLLQAVELMGLPHAAVRGFLKLAALVFAGLLIVLILQNRRPVRDWLRRDHTTRFRLKSVSGFSSARRWFAHLWAFFAIAFVVVTYLSWTFNFDGGPDYLLRAVFGTLGLVILARILSFLVDQAADRAMIWSERFKSSLVQVTDRAGRYIPVLQGLAHWAILGGFILGSFYAWGLNSFSWLNTHNVYVQKGFGITLVAVGAIVTWEVVSAAIERLLLQKTGSVAARGARMRTLLPLLRNFCFIFILTIAMMIMLGEVGIDTRPLLAGAGVIGVALGFGSQTLVKDVITGMFILFENTITVGDSVDLGKGHAGTVEGLSIRTLRVRDGNGGIHTVPFSEVSSIINTSRDYSVYTFDITVNYRADTDAVVAILRELGAELLADPSFRDNILEPLDIWGVDGFNDNGVDIKAALKTRPGQQWGMVRAFNRRLKQRLDEAGIRPPMRRTEIFADPPPKSG